MPFEADAKVALSALQEFYDRSAAAEHRAIHQQPMADLIEELNPAELLNEGGFSGEKFSRFLDQYLSGLTPIYHPANVAHQQAVPHYMAALAGLIDNFVSGDGSTRPGYPLAPRLLQPSRSGW